MNGCLNGPDRLNGPGAMEEEACYLCSACGEQIVVPVERSAGPTQEYVEDCPVCCHPNLLVVRFDRDGRATIDARAE